MKKLLMLLVPCLLLTSCNKKEIREYRFSNDGLIYKNNSSELFTGKISDTADVIIEFNVIKGRKSGEFVTHYLNGKIEKKGLIKNNSNEGEWEYYYPTGILECKGYFVNNIPDGLWQRFYENGNLKETGSYIEGKQNGEWVFYNKDGKIKQYLYYVDGKTMSQNFNET